MMKTPIKSKSNDFVSGQTAKCEMQTAYKSPDTPGPRRKRSRLDTSSSSVYLPSLLILLTYFSEREAKSRVKEKKPPKAAINLGTDVDAPWGEKIETSRKDNHQNA